MLPFAGNYCHDRRFSHTEWLCFCGEVREDESHLLAGACMIYGGIRQKYGDLDDDEDLIDFFNKVLEKREEVENQREAGRGLDGEDTLVAGLITTDEASLGDYLGRASP